MDKKLEKILLKNNVELNNHIMVKQEHKVDKYAIYSYIAFGILLVLFLFDMFSPINLRLNGFIIYIALSLLVLYPIATRDTSPKECLCVTEEGLLKLEDKTLIQIKYDEVTRYKFDDLNIYISKGKELMTINRNIFSEVLESIIDILEAKGKTFDPKKDYMIREVEIKIIDGKVVLKDVEEEETVTEKITSKFLDKYDHLTPGFIKEIIPRNSIVRSTEIYDNHLDIFVDRLTVKGEHPENTTFDNQEVFDCIFIFENARIAQYAVKESNEKSAPYKLQELTSASMLDELKDSVIDEWQYGINELIFIFKAGLGNIKIHLKYDEVIIGWNKVR